MLLIARIALVAVVCLPAGLPAQDAFVPHQLLIRLDPSITDADQREIVRSFGVSVRTHYGLLRMWWVFPELPRGHASGIQQRSWRRVTG